MNNDFEGPGKGHEILRYIDPLTTPSLKWAFVTLSLEKSDLSLPFIPDVLLCYNWMESSQGTGHTGIKKQSKCI